MPVWVERVGDVSRLFDNYLIIFINKSVLSTGGEGGIVRLSRCILESLIPRCARDRTSCVLRGRCPLVEPEGSHPPDVKKDTLASVLFILAEGGSHESSIYAACSGFNS